MSGSSSLVLCKCILKILFKSNYRKCSRSAEQYFGNLQSLAASLTWWSASEQFDSRGCILEVTYSSTLSKISPKWQATVIWQGLQYVSMAPKALPVLSRARVFLMTLLTTNCLLESFTEFRLTKLPDGYCTFWVSPLCLLSLSATPSVAWHSSRALHALLIWLL